MKHKVIFPVWITLKTIGFNSPKVLIISHFLSLVAVPVSASTGTGGHIKLICKELSIFANAIAITMVIFPKGERCNEVKLNPYVKHQLVKTRPDHSTGNYVPYSLR